MNSIADAIHGIYNDVSGMFGGFLAAMAWIGTVTMALIQTIKDLTPLRQWYQRRCLKHWLQRGALAAAEKFAFHMDPEGAEKDLLNLAVDGVAPALYDLPIEQMCGQINAALQVVLDYPENHPSLFGAVASQAGEVDIRTLLTRKPPAVGDLKELSPELRKQVIDYTDARNRVTHQTQRAVDAFQIATGFRWKRSLQVASFVISAIIASLAVAIRGGAASPFGTILATGLLAGFLAPVARDLLAALQKWRS